MIAALLQRIGVTATLPGWTDPVVLVALAVGTAFILRHRFRTRVLVAGLAIVVPLLWTLAKGFQFDPHYIASPLVGKPVPEFDLPRLDGTGRMTRAELVGKPAVVNFWATWCIPCEQEHPWLVRIGKSYGDRVNFVGIVYQDEVSAIEAWLQRHGGTSFPTLIDEGSSAAIAFGVYGVPETYVVDSSGTILKKYTGPVDPDDLVARLNELAAAPTAEATTRRDVESVVGPPVGPPLEGEALRQRTHEVALLLRCPTCQGMSAGESPSDSARAIRLETEKLLAAGYDEEQILTYFEASYGEFIRLDPKREGFNLAVWLLPGAFVVVGAFLLFRRPRARTAPAAHAAPPPPPAALPPPPAAPTPADDDPYLQRLRDELDG